MRQLWLLCGICLCIVGLLVLLVTTILIPTAPWNGDLPVGDGNSAVVTLAMQMAEHLHAFPNPFHLWTVPRQG